MVAASVPIPTLRRLPKYYHYLRRVQGTGQEIISATQMAEDLGIHHTQVRKDLAATGSQGKPKVGHRVEDLLTSIEAFLNWNNFSEAFLVGVGNLGSALLGYTDFEKAGIRIVAAFDTSPLKVGHKVHGIDVFPISQFEPQALARRIAIGIITVPADRAQHIAEIMVRSGLQAIWNFAPITLDLPEEIIVENVELYASLAIFSRKLEERRKAKALAAPKTI
ncbi:MAG: redox-sensing transcriptional repressor Rex [Holophaga sp.]|nr:redox-sensing transcriptional repressor Rex [Holophaga sp.]